MAEDGPEHQKIKEENLVFVGLVGMIDPPRPECKNAVDIFKKAGITTIMITGDHKTTALAIAKKLGITDENGEALSGEEIDALTPEELQEKVKTVHVFARVSPENKVQIVTAVKANGNIAAMTGDGIRRVINGEKTRKLARFKIEYIDQEEYIDEQIGERYTVK